jgi:hypothetical protein
MIWHPYRLVSLLEILKVPAGAFCRMSSLIGQMIIVLAQNRLPEVDTMGQTLGELQREATRLGIRSVTRQLERIRENLDSGKASNATMHPMMLELNNRLVDELSDKQFLMMDDEAVRYYEQQTPLFGQEVQSNFLSASFEIDEAGKCVALNRGTAAVFHLMRAMEIAVGAVARCLAIPDPVRPADRNWGAVLKKVRDGIDHKWPTVAERSAGDGEFFDGLYASLDAVKNPWRNSTMHPANKYTPEEAEHVFSAVRGFMMKLASRCDENGDPKA